MLFHKIRNLKVKCLILFLTIPVIIFFVLVFGLNFYFGIGMKACLGDCLMMISGRNFNIVLMITVWISMYIFKEENKHIVLKQASRQAIYRKNFFLMVLTQFILILYLYFCTVLIGSFLSVSFLNWNQATSIYCMVTESTNHSLSFLQVLLISLIFNFISIISLNSIFIAVYFITKKYIYGCLCLVVIVTMGYKVLEMKGFNVRLFADYNLFQSMNCIGIHILVFLIISILAFGIGYVNAERKDYLE